MSKQEHEKDGHRAPSGAGKDDTPGDAPKTPVTDKSTPEGTSASERSDAGQKAAEGNRAAAASGKRSANGRRGGKGGSGQQDANRPVATGKPDAADKSAESASADTRTGAKPLTDTQDSNQKSQGGPAPGKGDSAPDKRAAASPAGPKGTDTTPSGGGTSSGSGTPPSNGTPSGSGTPPSGGGGGNGGKRGGGTAGVIALILVLLLILAAAIGGWWAWQKFSDQQAQLSQLSRVESNASAIDDLESQLNQLEQQRGQQREQALQSMREAMRNEMQQYQNEVNQTLDRVLEELASEQDTDPGQWLYAEVEYLLRLANQRLQLERDVEGARSLLRTADERLAQADNPALTPVRRAIQSELGALGSVPTVDRTGLYLTLMAQQEQLAQLPLEQDIAQVAAEGGDLSQVGGAWLEQLKRFGQELKELVVVRKHDQALEALMTPEQEAYLRQNVRLQLEQAQLALLEANPELYQASLEKAVTLIEGYYDTGHDGVQQVLEQLRSLNGRTVRPELPDISGSLEALRNFMARRQDGGSADA